MKARRTPIRTSVSLTRRLARRIRQIARAHRTSANKVLLDLLQEGLKAREREKQRFLELTERLAASKKPAEQQALKKELAKMTFGR